MRVYSSLNLRLGSRGSSNWRKANAITRPRRPPAYCAAARCRSPSGPVRAAGSSIEVFVIGVDGVVIDENGKAYKGTVDALRNSPYPVYFATSKDATEASEALTSKLGLDIPEDSPRLFGSLQGGAEAKCVALRSISERPVCQDPKNTLIYIDNNLGTLKAVGQDGDLGRWNLYLAEWGCNAAGGLAGGDQAAGLQTISLEGFC